MVHDFTPNLSVVEFISYLKKEGLSDQDCEIMKGDYHIYIYNNYFSDDYYLTASGIGAKTFATDFGDSDISSTELGFTFGGKKVLRRLLRVCVPITSL